MLITQDWTTPQKVEYGKNITLRFSKPGFTLKVFNPSGGTYEKEITEGKEYEISASEISAISHPSISLRSNSHQEIHLHIELPLYQ